MGEQLHRYGVLVSSGKEWRRYWLPGVATFDLRFPVKRTVEVSAVTKLAAQPAVRVKPQERTRGLPGSDRAALASQATARPQRPA